MPVINHIWDELSDNILIETDENGAVIASYTNEPSQFGEVVSKHQDGENHYFHFDGLGSTRNLTDQNQAVTDSYTYTAFGEMVASSGTTPNPFRFNGSHGYYTNEETGDFYVRRRTYNPSLARWLSRDPLGFIDGPNVYVYVRNFVPNGIDPTGMIKIELVGGDRISTIGCGGFLGIFMFSLEDDAPCNGYLVQEVTVWELVLGCEDCPPGFGPPFGRLKEHFWEAWFIEENERIPDSVFNFTDQWSQSDRPNSCGHQYNTGTLKFYCTDEPADWPTDNNDASGGLHSTSDEPTWWSDAPIEGPKTHRVDTSWCCCDCICDESLYGGTYFD